jgi:hypothetical protein
LPISFACFIEIKHCVYVGLPKEWKFWLEFSIALTCMFVVYIILPLIFLIKSCKSRSLDKIKPAIRIIGKGILVGTIVWAPYDLY